ncbi:MAG: exodeoxyribonuclease VII large subunit [Solirubrobacteraceae bacterium]|nr:exodeoxyribonuclease VII large subunit [Solirubrobacteraceae bacterium]
MSDPPHSWSETGPETRRDATPGTAGASASADVFTVSRLNREVRVLLERGLGSLWIEGEISNLSRPGSGHWYFSLKDEAAQVRCAMFRSRNLLVRFPVRDGTHVLARGRVSLYEPRGEFQLVVEHLEEAGEGLLRRRFEELKQRLAAEGLFDLRHKQPLPRLPRRIGVITSPTGAAIRDVLHVLRRRFPAVPVLVYPVAVQGAAAAGEIAQALALAAQRRDCDVLIVARGGGSLEDLWAFNEEVVARAIFACPLPVVSGVGHEVDVTIADLVADERAPTPSAAAERVVPDRDEWRRKVGADARRLVLAVRRRLAERGQALRVCGQRLARVHPGVALRRHAQRLDELGGRLAMALRARLRQQRARHGTAQGLLLRASPALRVAALRLRLEGSRSRLAAAGRNVLAGRRQRLGLAARTLDAVSPLATLDRGYAIVSGPDGHVVQDATTLRTGERIAARLARGSVAAQVLEVRPDPPATDGPA